MKTKVYYADTDAGGVVYYANYLRWLEMARADWLEQLGTPLRDPTSSRESCSPWSVRRSTTISRPCWAMKSK